MEMETVYNPFTHRRPKLGGFSLGGFVHSTTVSLRNIAGASGSAQLSGSVLLDLLRGEFAKPD